MARFLWLADVLRAAGLTVHEYNGWKTRGLESFGPVLGVVCHGTGGSLKSTDAGETQTIAVTGSNTAQAPIAQLYQSRSGAWTVLASGTCTGVKTGTSGPLRGYGDDAVLQIEAQHHPTEPWTAVQYHSYVVGVAALVKKLGIGLKFVIGHSEHQPGEKTDPWFDMNQFRRDVAAVLNGDEMSAEEVNAKLHAIIALGGTSMGEPVAPEYRLNVDEHGKSLPGAFHNSITEQLAEARGEVAKLRVSAPVTPEEFEAMHERVMRKLLGSVDGATPAAS